MSFDNVCKILAEKYPLDFANWLLPEEVEKIKVLKTELNFSRFTIREKSNSSIIE
ncbi:hypothetical protein [Dolichospermum flos-aquae]|uniref:hypothetical protein n=1 Tax=Dolichospermum flosaquae TaxID=1166 RepID=UPI0038990491